MGFNKSFTISKKEVERIMESPESFLEFCMYGFNAKNQKIEKFSLYDFQKQTIKFFEENNYCIINKSRQMFVDTMAAGYCLWKMLKNNNYNILYISYGLAYSSFFIEKMDLMTSSLPSGFLDHLKIKVKKESKGSISLSNDSNIKVVSPNNLLIGKHINACIISEAAYVENLKNIIDSVVPLLQSNNGKLILYSNPGFEDDYFHKLYMGSGNGEINFANMNLHWILNPLYNKGLKITYTKNGLEYTSDWYDIEKLKLRDSVKHELDLQFRKRKKENIITFRLDDEISKKMSEYLLNPNCNFKNISEYLRYLITQNLGI